MVDRSERQLLAIQRGGAAPEAVRSARVQLTEELKELKELKEGRELRESWRAERSQRLSAAHAPTSRAERVKPERVCVVS